MSSLGKFYSPQFLKQVLMEEVSLERRANHTDKQTQIFSLFGHFIYFSVLYLGRWS